MQTVNEGMDQSFQTVVVRKSGPFRMTSRDMDILEFALEMKFSTIDDIHAKFFKFTRGGEQSTCLRWARERVAHLVRSGFLRAVKDVCYRTLYIVTSKGYFYLRNSRPERSYSRPLASVDGRTYDHDQKMIQLRTVLEEKGTVAQWISERQLTELDEYRSRFSTEFRPDGIYVTREGVRVAFELEIARKSKERYQQKVKRYIQMMSEPEAQSLFSQVHFVCAKETVLRLIQDQAELFHSYFTFNLLTDVLK